MESTIVVIDDTPEDKKEDEDDVSSQLTDVPADVLPKVFNIMSESTNSKNPQINKGPSIRVQKDHLTENDIGNLNEGCITRSRDMISNLCFISKIEPTNIKEAFTGEFWINVMQEELSQFIRNKARELVPRLEDMNVSGTKWIFKNKFDENGNMTRTGARLVAQGYTQIEVVDFDETSCTISRIESIRYCLEFPA